MKPDNNIVTFTTTMPYGVPNANGTVYTREAIETAFKNIPSGTEISVPLEDGSVEKGYTTGHNSIKFDEETNTAWLYLECTMCGIVKDWNDKGEITEFEVTSFGVSK